MIKKINTIDWHVFHRTLCRLAKRKNPKAKTWVHSEDHGMFECYICDGAVWHAELVEHGLKHIKERKLIAFL
jgi:hypothetical protein